MKLGAIVAEFELPHITVNLQIMIIHDYSETKSPIKVHF